MSELAAFSDCSIAIFVAAEPLSTESETRLPKTSSVASARLSGERWEAGLKTSARRSTIKLRRG